jgi:hypothetical protein
VSLEVLELRDLRPWDISVRNLNVDTQSFQLLDAEEQASLKATVPNLYVRSLQPRSRYFASSFVSDD